jgi:hypothetical protein
VAALLVPTVGRPEALARRVIQLPVPRTRALAVAAVLGHLAMATELRTSLAAMPTSVLVVVAVVLGEPLAVPSETL